MGICEKGTNERLTSVYTSVYTFRMTTKVQKWGNSLAVRLPKDMARALSFKAGTPVSVKQERRGIMIVPKSEQEPTLEELVEQITPENRHEEIDWGLPAGKRSMVTIYVPEQGDIVWLSLGAGAGRKQRGRRPALVLSPKFVSVRSHLTLVCPITSHVKGYPFEVPLAVRGVPCVLLVDQIRAVDWTKRKMQFLEHADGAVVTATVKKVAALIGFTSQ